MLLYSITPLVKKTSEVLNFPMDKTAPVILHVFKEMRRNQTEFFTVGFQLEDLGKFRIHPNKMLNAVTLLIKAIRNDKRVVEHKITLSNLFKFRHHLKDYYDSRKYKERFGS